jgi:predicted transglutaminase-like cysteine proteinase
MTVCCVLPAFSQGAQSADLQPASITGEMQIASLGPINLTPFDSDRQNTEPFAVEISGPIGGGLERKWRFVTDRLPRERKILARCRRDAKGCTPAAAKFLAVIKKAVARQGWARIAEINRAINLDVRPVDDQTQYGVADLWATPLMTLATNAGDCEDYAIAKLVALKEAGVSAADLRLVIVHDRAMGDDHAVAAVRHEGRWLVLDNRTLDMREDVDIANFVPLFVIDSEGVKRATARPEARQVAVAETFPVTAETPESNLQFAESQGLPLLF